ncbi:sensor histidine kinase [Streptomyces sp. CMB-StM0423]|uniref:sensor histidine kinase n=1 Tax=Streptomyces sp. CMB-StM0423 TaxID=2059884 RepID=UPI000C709C79|nr:histidine kinase [Streptomyces sp. CMB-StM0423]AUH39979.1 two-component sensor histidine kinase [Streptomyces sp. CMB-StM0423]
MRVTESTPQAPRVRGEFEVIRDGWRLLGVRTRTTRREVFKEALALTPLPALPPEAPVVRGLPPAARRVAVWLPHMAIVALALYLFGWGSGWYGISDSEYYDEFGSYEPHVGALEGRHIGLPVSLAAAVPLLLVLFRPVGAWWLSLVVCFAIAATVSSADDWPWADATFVSHLVVLTIAALRRSVGTGVAMWLLTTLSGLVASWLSLRPREEVNALQMTVASAVVIAVAVSVRGWTAASRRAEASGALTAQERSRRTRLEKRTSIAHELHDVVAHHMSVIAIQAEAAPYRVENPPPELTASFATIRENAIAALAELRRVLGVVRTEDYEAPSAPQPTLADLDRLLGNVRDTGLTVEKTVTGARRELPQGVELSAYRIVQEALSNVLRHAPGAAAKVELSYVLGGLALRIVNEAPAGEPPPSPGAGQGVTGMRERVAMLGGRMTAGETPDGGYEVAVLLLADDSADDPLEGPADAPVAGPADGIREKAVGT